MRAAWFDPAVGLTVRDNTADPVPAAGEVLLTVEACGVCGSDKGVVGGGPAPPGTRFPLILGHEIAGAIAAVDDVASAACATDWQTGDEVVAMPFIPCGKCRSCQRGDTNLCLHMELVGYHRQGGYAERVALPANLLLRRPPGVAASAAAVLTDAFATPFHALSQARKVEQGSLLVIGSGGTGLAAVLLAPLFGIARTAVLTRREASVEAVLEAGAEAGFATEGEPRRVAREVRRWSHGGPDLVLDTVATESSVEQAIDVVRPGGCIVVIGLGADRLRLAMAKATRKGISLVASFGSTRHDVQQLLDLAQAGRLDPGRVVANTLQLNDIRHAFAPGGPAGRTVICVQST